MDSSQHITTVLVLINSLQYFKGLSCYSEKLTCFVFCLDYSSFSNKTHSDCKFQRLPCTLLTPFTLNSWSDSREPCRAPDPHLVPLSLPVLQLCVCVCMCVWLLVQEREAGVTARPLPKVTSKESQANYYADQNWWRLRGLLQCNHISWPEKNLQADPNHRGYSARVSQDGGLPPMFSFHKTLFPYLRQAHDYQTKQASSSTFLQTCACIYIFKNAYGLQKIQYTQVRHLGYKKYHPAGPKKMQNSIIQSSEWCQGVSQKITSQFITLWEFLTWPFHSSHVDTQVYYTKLSLLYSVS